MTVTVQAETVCNRIGVQSFAETDLARTLKRLPSVSGNGPWLAGGAVRRTIEGRSLDSDFDFFFASQEQADKFAADLLALGGQLRAENDKNHCYIVPSKVASGAEEKTRTHLPELKVQLITFKFFPSAADVISSFDFTLCVGSPGTELEFAL